MKNTLCLYPGAITLFAEENIIFLLRDGTGVRQSPRHHPGLAVRKDPLRSHQDSSSLALCRMNSSQDRPGSASSAFR